MKESPKMPLLHSICWIVGSVLVISSISYKTLQVCFVKKTKKTSALQQKISYIVQTGFQKEALHSDYLAELLKLSIDEPVSFSSFNEEEANERLLSSPVIQEATVRKIDPNMVYVDYTVRRPLGWASDFVNIAIDKEGYLFPVYPFFSPKKLPEFYLGKEGVKESCKEGTPSFKEPFESKRMDLAFKTFDLLVSQGRDLFTVKRVDVSNAFAPTLGKREIVVVLENELYGIEPQVFSTHFLRLSSKQSSKEILNYLSLRSHLLEMDKQEALLGSKAFQERVIDLRLSQLAFVD